MHRPGWDGQPDQDFVFMIGVLIRIVLINTLLRVAAPPRLNHRRVLRRREQVPRARQERVNQQSPIGGCESTPVKDDPDAIDVNLTFTLTEGSASSAGVAVAFDFDNGSADNYVLAPAAVYDGNRFRILPIG
jgi:hypothetical protein